MVKLRESIFKVCRSEMSVWPLMTFWRSRNHHSAGQWPCPGPAVLPLVHLSSQKAESKFWRPWERCASAGWAIDPPLLIPSQIPALVFMPTVTEYEWFGTQVVWVRNYIPSVLKQTTGKAHTGTLNLTPFRIHFQSWVTCGATERDCTVGSALFAKGECAQHHKCSVPEHQKLCCQNNPSWSPSW